MDCAVGPQRRRLLIVGDPALSRGLMRMVLSQLGYVVSVVATGTEALTMRAHTRFALALVASRLPDMPGVALARHLSEPVSTAGTPVLMFGDAFDQPMVLREAAELGLAGFLVKPISIGRLVTAVRTLTAGRANGGPNPELTPVMQTPLDLQRLREFTDGDEQLERELSTLFVETASIYIEQMRAALDDVEDWRRAAHALKGASANIGATQLAELAARAEKTAPSDTLIDELAGRLLAVRSFLGARPHAVATARD